MSKLKKVVRKQPARKVKRKRESMEEPTSEFDMIGILLSNYGMTGQNLVREIFSNMDFWKIQTIRLVCKSWNIFISEDRILILKIVRQAEPYLEDFCCKLSENSSSYSGSEYDCCAECGPRSETDLDRETDSESVMSSTEESKSWKEFFDCVESKEEICSKKLFQLGKKIHCIFAIAQTWGFKGYLIGQTLGKDIRMEIRKKIDDIRDLFVPAPGPFVPWLFTCEMEFAKIFMVEQSRALYYKEKYTLEEMQEEIRKELAKVLEI